MPVTTRVLLHQNGPALWPQHKPLSEVHELRDTTPEHVWEGTYQGNPTPPGGVIFLRDWWNTPERRFHPGDLAYERQVIARYISWDTADKDKQDNAYTVGLTVDLLADYRLAIRDVYRDRIKFPDLVGSALYGEGAIPRLARQQRGRDKLRGIILEDKASGTSAYQTLAQAEDDEMRQWLRPFLPTTSKEQRARQASVWCKLGCVLVPWPSERVPWLTEYLDELTQFPGATFADQVDATTQVIIYLEHLLSEGYHARVHAPSALQSEWSVTQS